MIIINDTNSNDYSNLESLGVVSPLTLPIAAGFMKTGSSPFL